MSTFRGYVFLGPPGSGKGTQAAWAGPKFGLPHISTGDLFRANLKEQTPVGLMAKGFMDRGLLVPDDVVCTMVRERIEEEDAEKGFIFDGFPRTVPQAEALEGDLGRLKRKLSGVVSFEIADKVLVERLAGRLTCRGCGAVYNKTLNPPKKAGTCDTCGGSDLYVRADDQAEAVRARLVEYHDKTAPLLAYYGQRKLVRPIDASKGIAEVRAQLEAALERR